MVTRKQAGRLPPASRQAAQELYRQSRRCRADPCRCRNSCSVPTQGGSGSTGPLRQPAGLPGTRGRVRQAGNGPPGRGDRMQGKPIAGRSWLLVLKAAIDSTVQMAPEIALRSRNPPGILLAGPQDATPIKDCQNSISFHDSAEIPDAACSHSRSMDHYLHITPQNSISFHDPPEISDAAWSHGRSMNLSPTLDPQKSICSQESCGIPNAGSLHGRSMNLSPTHNSQKSIFSQESAEDPLDSVNGNGMDFGMKNRGGADASQVGTSGGRGKWLPRDHHYPLAPAARPIRLILPRKSLPRTVRGLRPQGERSSLESPCGSETCVGLARAARHAAVGPGLTQG